MKIEQIKAKAILDNALRNTIIPLEAIIVLSDELKRSFLLSFYSKENVASLYNFIYDKRRQDYILDFLYEVFREMLSYDLSLQILGEMCLETNSFISKTNLNVSLKDMIRSDVNKVDDTDVLIDVLFFLRLYNVLLDEAIISRKHHDDALKSTFP